MANLLSDDDVFGSAPSGLLSDADVFGKGAKTEPGGFVASAKQAIGATVKGAGQAAADFIPGVSQENALKRYGQEIIEANPTAVHSFSDLADKPWTAVKEATGNALSSMGGVVGSRALGMGITAAAPFTGPAAPVVAGVGQAISWLGPVAARALPSFGGIREQQIHDDPNAANSAAAKAAAAVGAGTVGAIESRFGPEAWGSKMLTKAGRKEVAKLFAAKTLPQAVAKGAVRGAAVEGAEELAQNPVEQLAAFQNPLTAEALKDTAFSGAMGALGGGVLGGGTGAASRYLPKKPDVDPGNQPAEPPKALPAPTYTGTIRYEPGLIPGIDVGGPTEPPSFFGGGIDFTPPQLPDTGPLSRAANLALGASVPMERQAFFPFQSFAAAERMRNGRDDLVTRQHPSIPGRFTLVPAGLETPVARQAKPDVQQGTGSFSDQNELANFIADERKDQSARKAALAEGKNNAIAQADQAVADARQFATRNERLSILDGVLSSLAPGQNPNRRFDSALKAAGFRDTSFTEEERAVIGRYGNVASAFAVAPEASVEPSSPGEIEAAIPAAKGKGDSGIAGVRADRVRSAIAAGFTQRKGFSLINPATGEKFALKTPGMIRAAKEALEQSNPTTEIKSEAVGLDHESGSQQRPDQDGSRGNMPTVRSIDGGDRPASGAPAPGSEPAVSVGDGSGPDAALSRGISAARPRGPESRDDLLGAILRVTGNKGISAGMAQTITGDKAGSGNAKLRGLFTNDGIADLDDTAELLRTEEGYDVRDGNHLAELIREQSAGNAVYSMERTEREAQENAEKEYKASVNQKATELGLKKVGGKRTLQVVEAEILAKEQEINRLEAEAERQAIQAADVLEDGEVSEAEFMRLLSQTVGYTEEEINAEVVRSQERADRKAEALSIADSDEQAQRSSREGDGNQPSAQGTGSTEAGARSTESLTDAAIIDRAKALGMKTAGVSAEKLAKQVEEAEFNLTQQTNAEASAEYKKQQEEANKKDDEPTSPNVTADQVDMWNTQDALFNSNRDAAKPAVTEADKAVSDTQEFTHNGVRIYPISVNVGGERKQMWGIESAENKAKREAGERHGFGDSLVDTPEQAKAAADRMIADTEAQSKYDEAQKAKQEEEAKRKADIEADTFNGFLDGKTPAKKGLIRKALAKQWRFDGVVMTARERIESLLANGQLEVGSFEEDKIKPMTRAQFNRATQREQDAHEKKVREGGKVTVYTVSGSELGKIAHDYAQHLLSQKSPVSQQKTDASPESAQDKAPAITAEKEQSSYKYVRISQVNTPAQGVQSGLFTADGRVSVEAKQPEKPAEVTKPKNEQQETAGLPAATDGGSRPVPAVPALEETYRPLIERLIRNKRVAKELGFDIDGAIAKAKAAMAGTKQMPGSFRALAKRAEKKGDTETAAILNQVADLNDGRKAKATVVKDSLTTEPAGTHEFIKAPDGSIDFGEITGEQAKAMRRQSGKIKLTRGVQNADGTGYGLIHIEENHGKQIRAAGFDSVESFVAHVARDFGQVWQATGRQVLVAFRDGNHHMMYVQLEPANDGDYYRVNTAFPVRQQDYPERHGFKKLWDGSEPASAVTGEQPAYAGQSENSTGQTTPNARGQSASTVSPAHAVGNAVDAAANEAATSPTNDQAEPTPAQKEAGTDALYSKGDETVSAPMPQSQAEQRIKSLLGNKVGRLLIESGIITFTNKGDAYQGATYTNGTIALNLDALSADNFDGVLLHEGFHSTIKQLVGEETYTKLMKQLENMLGMGRGAQWVKDANAAVPKKTAPENVTEEIAAYAIEQHKNGGKIPSVLQRWVQSFLSAIRTAIIQRMPNGKLKSWAIANVTAQDLANLALAGLKAKAAGQMQAQGREAMAYSTAFGKDSQHRTPLGDATEIEVDGIKRPALNSNGKPIHWSREGVENFWRWFSDSKVVDAEGRPLVVYHGTRGDFSVFDAGRQGQSDFGTSGRGFYLSQDPGTANVYATLSPGDGNPNIMPFYVSLKNPYELGARLPQNEAESRLLTERVKAQGYDGIIVRGADGVLDEIVAFSPEQIKSATGNTGDFDGSNPDIRYSKASQTIRSAVGAVTWAMPSESKMDDIIYAMQDKHIDLKRVVESIKKTAGSIADNIDPYLQEELFHGRAAKAVKDFLDLELRPLIAEMRMRGVGMADFEEYLWNRHAEERNAQIAKINPQMEDGGSGLKTADAQAYLAGLSSDKRKAYELLAAKIDAITAKNRQVLVESGLEKAETVAAWEGAYKHYVPLQREDVETGGNGTGQGFSVRGTSSKRAVGSGRPVADIIANLAMQRERFIVKAEKNRVSIAIAGLAASNPNPDFWKLNEAPKERVVNNVAIYNVLDANGNKVADFTRMDEAERMAMSMGGEVEQTWDDRVQERIVPGFKNQENVVHFRLNGEDHFVIFNEREPRAMRMAQSIKNLDMDQLGRVLTVAGKVTRYFAAINTQYNPIFGIINLFRDVQGALLNLSTTPLAGEQKRVAGYTVDALRGIYADIRAHRAGKVPSSRWAKLYEEFQNEGGQTGYRDQFSNAEQRAEAIAKEIKAMDRNAAFKAAGAVFDWLSDYNQAMENAVRLAAYAAAKERGLSKQQAASLAKNLTVNFNRKGQVATQMGALYAFFNASMQGTARLAQTLTGPMGRRIITGGVLLGSMQAMLLASAGMGDDEPPEFVRERNLILPIGDGKYISLPMPLGFHVLPNLGRIPTEFVMSGFREPARRISDLVGIFADAFNPIGNAGLSLQTIAPTVVDPFAALAENKDWTGKPIAKLDMNANAPTPGHSRAKDTATAWSKAISEAINYLSGGTRYKPGAVSPTPDQIDYLIGQVTGGVGREAAKVEQTATSMVLTGEDLPLHKVPLVGRFVGDTKGQSAEGSKFYAALKRINEHENEIKGMRKDGRGAEVAEYIRENPDARLVLYGNHVEREVQKLRSAKRDALERGDAGRVRMIESALTAKMRAFNERVRSAQGSNN